MKRLLGFLVFGVSLAACGSNSNDKFSFTLYQSSVTNPNMRVRLAVYDAPKGRSATSRSAARLKTFTNNRLTPRDSGVSKANLTSRLSTFKGT